MSSCIFTPRITLPVCTKEACVVLKTIKPILKARIRWFLGSAATALPPTTSSSKNLNCRFLLRSAMRQKKSAQNTMFSKKKTMCGKTQHRDCPLDIHHRQRRKKSKKSSLMSKPMAMPKKCWNSLIQWNKSKSGAEINLCPLWFFEVYIIA